MFVTAIITELRDLSPTVKWVGLSVQPEPVPFVFKPGQWVDFFIPGIEKCGGFSMVSCPEELPRLHLAIKRADHAIPAKWVYHTAKVGRAKSLQTFTSSTLAKFERNGILICSGWKFIFSASVRFQIGDQVGLKPGGSFFWEMSEAAWVEGKRLVLIAGGVGINPM